MQSKHVLRALGLSLMAAFSLAAVMAAGAQAVAGEYKVLGSAKLATGQTFIEAHKIGTLVVSPLNIEIQCLAFKVVEGKIISGPNGEALTKVLFENCTVKQLSPLEALTTCVISNGGDVIATAIILSVLHNEVKYLLGEQDGAPLTTIQFTKGIGCTLPNPAEITGTIAFETSQAEGVGSVVKTPATLAATETLQTLLGDELKFGKNKSFIVSPEGVTVELSGAHKECIWGAI